MLRMLTLSFVGAIVYVILITGIDVISQSKDTDVKSLYFRKNLCFRIGYGFVFFILDYIWLVLFFYITCKEQTILEVIAWSWPILGLSCAVQLLKDDFKDKGKPKLVVTCVLAVISMVVCFSMLFEPAQNLIFIYDVTDVTYAVKSDEILAKTELKIDNAVNGKDRYGVENPEMRNVSNQFIAVYHVEDKQAEILGGNSEYIPGYAIQKKEEIPEFIEKRIYFDDSYINGRDALRTIRRKYHKLIIGKHKFDIDDKMNPYEIYAYRESKFFCNSDKEYGLLILNLQDGTSEKYPSNEAIPDWVDFKSTYPR